jgi:centromeric protein E
MASSSNEAPVLESACDRVSVGLRIRPLNSIELESKSVAVMVEEAGLKVVQLNDVGKDRMSEHSYDAVFGPAVSTARVYQSIASPLVQNTLDGYNSTIFAYGQTSSGKTHTMVGSHADPGVLKLSMKEIFGKIRKY